VRREQAVDKEEDGAPLSGTHEVPTSDGPARSARATRRPANPYHRRWLTPRPKLVTARERAIGCLLAEGLRPGEIANQLGITRGSVTNGRQSLYAKLQLHSVVDLVHYAAAHGWVKVRGRRGPTRHFRP